MVCSSMFAASMFVEELLVQTLAPSLFPVPSVFNMKAGVVPEYVPVASSTFALYVCNVVRDALVSNPVLPLGA